MTEPRADNDYSLLQRRIIDLAIRLGALFVLMFWCFSIIEPFILIVAWGAIVGVALYPLFTRLSDMLGNREKLVATLLSLLLIAALAGPAVLLTESLVSGAQALAEAGEAGELVLPSPPSSVAEWPVIGTQVYGLWQQAATDLPKVLQEFTPQIKAIGGWALSLAKGTGLVVVQFVIAFVIAGVLLVNARRGENAADALAIRLAGDRGTEFADMTVGTIRAVAMGIVGVSILQTALLSVGFLAIGLQAAGLLALLTLVLCVVQIGPTLVAIPAIIYVLYTADTLPASIFTIWTLAMMLIDNILKPLVFSRGATVPTLVIFLGSIGGILAYGIIGLFVGAVVLSLGYKLYAAWLAATPGMDERSPAKAD
ncbi:MAG: AI-2E family transporter [Gammaproteobacteria bacterium]|jgi:predicted PurR-regulated permease PerM